jgi:hypothetical protein
VRNKNFPIFTAKAKPGNSYLMKTKDIDALNIFLIFISLFLAFKLPFELFLFSYAVLGPLHYLTEINWLKQKNYFIHQQKWIYLIIFFTVLLSVPSIVSLSVFDGLHDTEWHKKIFSATRFGQNYLILLSLLFSIALVSFKKWKVILGFLLGAGILSALILNYLPTSFLLIGIFVPTIIHIYVFTLLFMIFGTMNNGSTPGKIAIVFLVLCPVIIAVSHIDPAAYVISAGTQSVFMASGFQLLTQSIGNLFGTTNGTFSLMSPIAIKIQVFIAFAYTYHYLNWFSKTSIIGWGKNISKPKLIVILVIWLCSIFLYWYDYKTGLLALFFLSFLHILAEFPLNIVSIKGIFWKAYNRRKAGNMISADPAAQQKNKARGV